MRRTIRTMIAAAAAAALLTGAALAQQPQRGKLKKPAEDGPPTLQTYEKNFPLKTVWTLIDFNGKSVPSSDDMSFSIDDNYRGTGYGGCNSWSASMFPQKGQKILMGPIAITKKTCDKDKTLLEINFLIALRSGPSWDLEGSTLILKGQRGGYMKFQRSL